MRHARQTTRSAFTIVEMLFAVAVIFLLMGLAIVGIRAATKTSRAVAERQTVLSLKMGVDQFKSEFGFFPHLVKDNWDGSGAGPLESAGDPDDPDAMRPVVYSMSVADTNRTDRDYLRGQGIDPDSASAADRRYSDYSIAYYIVGALGEEVDGVSGPGFLAPRRDGSFTPHRHGDSAADTHRVGRRYDSFYDTSKGKASIAVVDEIKGRVELRGPSGTAYRYYRWLRGQPGSTDVDVEDSGDLNIPKLFGNPADDANPDVSPGDANPVLRDAEFAIVSSGPDGVFGDFGTEGRDAIVKKLNMSSTDSDVKIKQRARSDNVVEVGK